MRKVLITTALALAVVLPAATPAAADTPTAPSRDGLNQAVISQTIQVSVMIDQLKEIIKTILG